MANTNQTGVNKLSGTHKDILIQLLADFYGNDEVIEYFKQEYNITMASGNVSFYRKSHEDDIIKKREKLNAKLLAIPIANKFYRLEERQKLLDDIKKHLWYEDVKTNKKNEVVYDKDDNPVVIKIKGNHNVANQIMDSVHKELDPDKLALTDPTGKKQHEGRIILPPLDNDNGDGDVRKPKK